MAPLTPIHFPPYHLDLASGQLWQGTQQLPLRPKPFAILRYLAEHPGQLVTKEELLKAVWPNTYVSEGLLNTYLRDLRRVLGDDPEAPRFIETVVRRGYRFIAPLTTNPQPTPGAEPRGQSMQAPSLVGRQAEVAQLHGWLEKALQGQRQVVFVTGEPGIGKTTLVEAFLEQLRRGPALWIGSGQCVQHYGVGEAYLPVLEAVGRLCRGPGGERLVALLGRQAPTWLVHMPALVSEMELEVLQRKVQGATRERMLRELAEALEVLTAEQPLILWLEDLQWSDPSTLDLLAVLAQRRDAARLLVIGTYRPADVIVSGHPLRAVKQALQLHRHCEELALDFLTEGAVAEYLAGRFAGGELPQELARVLHQRTEGNPLFLVTVVEDLLAQEFVAEVDKQWQLTAPVDAVAVGVPESLRQLIERQLERLTPAEQRVLEAASVAGAEFSALAVAAGVEEELERVETWCDELARRGQFLRTRGVETVPAGTLTGRYGFVHALYQSVLYERVGALQRIRLHRRMGERAEVVYGTRVEHIAAELAVHFERGQDYQRAVQYCGLAAENALRRSAPQEAIAHLMKGLKLLKTLPDTPERIQQELLLQLTLGVALMLTKGYAAPDVESTYARARVLCQQRGDDPQLFPALWGLFVFHLTRAEFQLARELGDQLLRLAQRQPDVTLLLGAHFALGAALLYLGELTPARTHLEQSLSLYDPDQHSTLSFVYGQDPAVACRSHLAWLLWSLGYPEQALQQSQAALAWARELAHPLSLAFALFFTALTQHFCREGQSAGEQAEELMRFAGEQGFPYWLGMATILHGRELVRSGRVSEGIGQMQQGLALNRAIGTGVGVRGHDIVHTKGPRQRGLNNWAKGPRQRGLIRRKPDGYWLFPHSSQPLNVV